MKEGAVARKWHDSYAHVVLTLPLVILSQSDSCLKLHAHKLRFDGVTLRHEIGVLVLVVAKALRLTELQLSPRSNSDRYARDYWVRALSKSRRATQRAGIDAPTKATPTPERIESNTVGRLNE